MKHDEHLHTLTGAYALDALTGEEQRAFAAHLRRCEACLGVVVVSWAHSMSGLIAPIVA
ncbi:zf-HC2 domain-containing protein [Streptomyces avidinii]